MQFSICTFIILILLIYNIYHYKNHNYRLIIYVHDFLNQFMQVGLNTLRQRLIPT